MSETKPQPTDLELALSSLGEEPTADELAAFLQAKPPAGEQELSTEELAADWRAVQRRLSGAPAPQAVASLPVLPFAVGPASKAGPWSRISTWRLLAAAALVGCVGLGAWVVRLSRPRGAEGNVTYAFLTASTETVRGEERQLVSAPRRVVLQGGPVALLLSLPDRLPGQPYEVVIKKKGAAGVIPLGTLGNLDSDEEGRLGLSLPQQMASPGVYVIELHGARKGDVSQKVTFELELVEKPAPAPDAPIP